MVSVPTRRRDRWRRYTMRRLGRRAGTVELWVTTATDGPGARWASGAATGDHVEAVGPRGKIARRPDERPPTSSWSTSPASPRRARWPRRSPHPRASTRSSRSTTERRGAPRARTFGARGREPLGEQRARGRSRGAARGDRSPRRRSIEAVARPRPATSSASSGSRAMPPGRPRVDRRDPRRARRQALLARRPGRTRTNGEPGPDGGYSATTAQRITGLRRVDWPRNRPAARFATRLSAAWSRSPLRERVLERLGHDLGARVRASRSPSRRRTTRVPRRSATRRACPARRRRPRR